MKIIEIKQYTTEIHDLLNQLLPLLSSSAYKLQEGDINTIIESNATHLLVAEKMGQYYGTLTLIIFKIPTGIRAFIEDVIVSEDARGQGVGRLLSEYAIDLAKQLGAKTVDLTSRPSREAANALYKKIGFEERETNVYRYTIK